MTPFHFEDLLPGQSFTTGSAQVTAESIKMFAAEFDPQPMHLDEGLAAGTFFGRLVGSGWQALCLTMRLAAEANWLGGTPLIGAQVDGISFRRPLLPGEVLTVTAEVIELRPSPKPDRGFAVLALQTFGDGSLLVSQRWTILLPRRA